MDEYQIEVRVERKMDALDKRYMSGAMNETEYKKAVKDLEVWACSQYDAIRPFESMTPGGISDANADQFCA